MKVELPAWLRSLLIFAGIVLLFYVLYIGKSLLMPLAFAALFAVLLDPLCNWLSQFNIGRIPSVLVSMLTLLLVILGIVILLSVQFMQFTDQIPEMTERLKTYTDQFLIFLREQLNIGQDQQIRYLNQGLNKLIDKSGQFITTIISFTTNVFSFLVLLPIYTFFLLYYRDIFKTFILKISEDSVIENVEEIIEDVRSVVQHYILGLMTVILILAIMNSAGLLLLGIDHAIFFGVLAGFLASIPYVGVILGSLPPLLYALLMHNSLMYPLGVIVVFSIVQFLEGNFITPNVMSAHVSINPLVSIIALLLGGQIWGIAGMILFIPLTGMLKVTFDHIPYFRPYGYLLGNRFEYEE